MKKIILILIGLLMITGCDKEIKNEEQNYNEIKIVIEEELLKEGLIINDIIMDSGYEAIEETNYKINFQVKEDITYLVKCIKFDKTINYCSKSEEILNINNKTIIMNNNTYSQNILRGKNKEKFLTYLYIVKDKYLIITTNVDKLYENGIMTVLDLDGNILYKKENITSDYHIKGLNGEEDINLHSLYPKLNEEKLLYYVCNKDEEKVYKYNYIFESSKEELIEEIGAKCHIDNFISEIN